MVPVTERDGQSRIAYQANWGAGLEVELREQDQGGCERHPPVLACWRPKRRDLIAMSIDGGPTDRDLDGTADGADHAGQGDGRQPRTDRQPAETLTRAEYADQVRARTSPIAQQETPRGTESGNDGPDTEDRAVGTAETSQPGPAPDQPSRAEPDASQERQESSPDQADDFAQPGSSSDATGDEPHWEDAWRLPDGRQVRVRMDGDRDWMHSGTAENLPTGEGLLSMEDDDAPRPEKLRRKFFDADTVEDFLDAEKEGAKTVQDVLSPPQHTGAHTLTPTIDISPVPSPQVDAGDTLTGITVLALLGAEAIRAAARHWRTLERT
jgi:hypothetical protein